MSELEREHEGVRGMIGGAKSIGRRLLPKNAFARGVGVLVGGTASAQILLILASPLLTRLYSPEDFGLLAVYVGFLALIGVVSSLRYELAIPLPEDDQEAANITVLCLTLVAASCILTAVLVATIGDSVALVLDMPHLSHYFWLLPLGVLVSGAYSVFNYWGIRTKKFNTIAVSKLRQATATIAIQLTAFKFGGIGLLLGQIAGHGVGATSLALPALRTTPFGKISRSGIKFVLSRYKRFPTYSTWDALSNTAGVQLPPILFAVMFSPAAAGLYALANRVLLLPMALTGTAIGQVFFSEAAEARRNGRISALVSGLHSRLAHIGMPPAIILLLIGPELFAWTFGSEWRVAGEFARWMAPWLYLVFVSSPISTLFAVMEQQSQGLIFQLVLLISRVGAILVGAYVGELLTTVILFSTASAFCWLGFLFWAGNLAGVHARSMIGPTLSALTISSICAAPIILVLLLGESSLMGWPAALTISVALICGRYWQLVSKAY